MATEIINTQIQGLKAETILQRFNDLESQIKQMTTPATNPESKLLTRTQTAEMLGVSIVTLWSWTKKGIVPGYRIGNQIRYKRTEIELALKKVK